MMNTPDQPSRNLSSRGHFTFARASAVLLILFAAMGMDGMNCNGGGNGNGNGNNNNNNNGSGPKPDVDASRDHILVASGATPTVTVVEYGDLQCPACGNFARNHYPRLKSDYIDTGKIRYVFRHYPLNSHPRAVPMAEAAECVANHDEDDFFPFIDDIFADQSDLTDGRARDLAGTFNPDLADYDACVAGDSEVLRVNQDKNTGDALGVEVTPTFFVEDVRVGRAGQTVTQIATDLFSNIDRMLDE